MPSLNQVTVVGNLTRDPELRTVGNGSSVADIQIAINSKYKSGDEWKEDVCFIGITAWGRQAETACEYLTKGSPVLVEGRLKYDEWEKDGQKRSKHTVVARRIQFLGQKNNAKSEVPSAPSGSAADDLPF